MLFVSNEIAPQGAYVARCLVHRGVGVTYAGSYYNPGTPPWPTANGTGAWGFDHTHPRAVAAMPKASKSKGRVFLGWETGECGVGFIGLDANGQKIWEWLRRGVGATHIATNSQHVYFTFHSGQHFFARVLLRAAAAGRPTAGPAGDDAHRTGSSRYCRARPEARASAPPERRSPAGRGFKI